MPDDVEPLVYKIEHVWFTSWILYVLDLKHGLIFQFTQPLVSVVLITKILPNTCCRCRFMRCKSYLDLLAFAQVVITHPAFPCMSCLTKDFLLVISGSIGLC